MIVLNVIIKPLKRSIYQLMYLMFMEKIYFSCAICDFTLMWLQHKYLNWFINWELHCRFIYIFIHGIRFIESCSELTNDISKTSKEDKNEYTDSDSDGGSNGLPFMMGPNAIMSESIEEFSLEENLS